MTMGPNSAIGTGSLILIMERQVDYIVEVAKKMQREHLKSIEPRKDAVRDFDEYLEVRYLQKRSSMMVALTNLNRNTLRQ